MTIEKNTGSDVRQGAYAYHALGTSGLAGLAMQRIAFAPETGEGQGGDVADAADANDAQKKAGTTVETEGQTRNEPENTEKDADAAGDENANDPAALKAEKAALLREVMEKKNKLREAEKKAAEALEQLKKFEGIDPDKVRELLRREAEAERQAAEAKGDFERVKAMMVEEHEREKKALQERIAQLEAETGSFRSTINELTIGNSFATSSYIRDSLTLTPTKARALYASHFELQDGRVVGYDKPAGAKDRTMLVGADGNPLSFDAAMKKIIEADPDKDTLIKAKVTPGSGSTHSGQQPTKTTKPSIGFGVDRIRASFEKI